MCEGNGCRSPMMEVILKALLNDKKIKVAVESGGVNPDWSRVGVASYEARVAMQRFGLDINGHGRRYVGDIDLTEFDLFLVTGREIIKKLFEFGVDGKAVMVVGDNPGVPNPWERGQEAYDGTAMAIFNWYTKNLDLIIKKIN